ncbi:hypothetical protein QUC31_007126 [Theobroma cacao]
MNVDAAVHGCPGEARIRGVPRDEKRTILMLFSLSVEVTNSNYAEFLTVWKGFQIATASRWANSHKIYFEGDSQNAVFWAINPHQVPWKLRGTAMKIKCLKPLIANWCARKIPLSANEVADSLAKSGIGRQTDLIWLVCDDYADLTY